MKNNIIKICALMILGQTILTAFFCVKILFYDASLNRRTDIVALNEIEILSGEIKENPGEDSITAKLDESIASLQAKLLADANETGARSSIYRVLVFYLISVIFVLIIFSYIYYTVLRPFEKLNQFAYEVAKGNFDSPLYYERKNLFGAFTWAFDNMRKEVKKARACEKEAIENNKTVIATISHDIKTPIASIRAYAEGLMANLDSNPERRRRYLTVIMSKCDEVSNLTNDLFLHSLSDLDKLKMYPEWYQAEEVIPDILKYLQDDKQKVHILGHIPGVRIYVDIRRLEQVFENLISNAVKYNTDSDIDISFKLEAGFLTCHIRDYGTGIDEEDLPFIFDKFYRGKNAGSLPGSGLGLYIVKYILEQMDGTVSLRNLEDGLEVNLGIPCQENPLI